MDFCASAVLQRMRDGLQNPANKLEGGFCMDNLQAVSEEMARMDLMEVQPIPDRVLLDTAEGEYLDRRALDYNETRNPAKSRWAVCFFQVERGLQSPSVPRLCVGAWCLRLLQQARSAQMDPAR